MVKFIIVFTWVVVIGLVNTIWCLRTIPVVVIGNVELWFKFVTIEIPPNSLPNFVVDPINIPILTTSMLGVTTVSTPVVVIFASSDWITPIPTCYFRVSTIAAFDTIGGVMLTWDQQCSNLLLSIGIHCGAICGCEYPFGSLFVVWIHGQICWFCGPH